MTSLRLIAALAFLIFAAPALAGQDLKSMQVLDSGPFLCSGPSASTTWINNSATTMYVRQAQVWMGMSTAGKGDYPVNVKRISDNSFLAITGWDHYAEPTGLHQLTMNYAPDYMAIAPGDGLILTYDCTKAAGTTQPNLLGHVSVQLWWTDLP
jgi:hypothetical protein